MISAVYASLLALLIVWLSIKVINVRRTHKVRLGDGDIPELRAAVRAQGNATEYIPILLILLILLELAGAMPLIIHLAGVAILCGRLIHARGIFKDAMPYRVLGMQITLYTLILLALANIAYWLYSYVMIAG